MRIPCGDGLTKDCSHPSEPPAGRVCTTSENISTSNKQKVPMGKRTSAIAESPPKIRRTTCKDKSSTCKIDSRPTVSSQTSDPGSTSNEKACDPSSSWLPKDVCDKLWLPTETDCADLHLNWFRGSFKSIKSNSWFSIKKWTPLKKRKWRKTFSPSSTFSIVESTEGGSTKDKKVKARRTTKVAANKSTRVGLRTTPELTRTLKQWFGCVRHTYNWALGCIKAKPLEYKKTNMIWLRKRFVNKCNIPKEKRFLLDTPKSIRDTAVSDLAQAYSSNFAKMEKNPSHSFDLKFRSKKDSQCITLTSEQVKDWDILNHEFSMFPTTIKNKIHFHVKKNGYIPDKVSYDCKLIMSRIGKFSMVIVFHEPPCESQAGEDSVCSFDPGVRTFQTIYSPKPGVCYKIGDNDIARIFRLCKHMDKMISSSQKVPTRMKSRAVTRMRERIKNLVKEVHCKTINFVLKKFKNVIIPPFEVSHMVKKRERKIRSKTVRQMLCWSHGAFKQRLLLAAERCHAKVHVRGEHYTSKTCTHCRNVKHNLGGAKIYKCHVCHLKADRDCCGARNIYIKNTSATLEPG